MPSPLGELIAAERKRHGVSLRGLARRVGKSPSFLVMIEKEDPVPAVAEETLVRLATVLGLSPDHLITLAGKTPSDVTPDDELEVELFREVKRLSRRRKLRLLSDLQKG
jgi:transcriptional regulator with XRE-family HTH domain